MQKQTTMTATAQYQLHLTVATFIKDNVYVEEEIDALKFALLYGDSIALFNTGTMLFLAATNNLLIGDDKREKRYITMEFGKKVLAKTNISSDELRYEVDEIIAAAESGLIRNIHVSEDAAGEGSDFDDSLYDALYKHIRHMVTSINDSTNVLTNQTIWDMIEKVKPITGKTTERGSTKSIALASETINRLPNFDRASVSEIIDIRKELEKPLIQFRSTVIDFSEHIKSETWDRNFTHDVESVFHKGIAPTVYEIEEKVRSSRYLNELTSRVADNPRGVPAGSAVAIAISQASAIPQLATYIASISTVAGADTIAYAAYREWKKKQQEIKQNKLLFLYKTQKRLAKV